GRVGHRAPFVRHWAEEKPGSRLRRPVEEGRAGFARTSDLTNSLGSPPSEGAIQTGKGTSEGSAKLGRDGPPSAPGPARADRPPRRPLRRPRPCPRLRPCRHPSGL